MIGKAIREHRAWMDRCGGSLEGYVKQYGSIRDPDHYGNGGEMIWAADMAELVRLYHQAQGHTITIEDAIREVIKEMKNYKINA